MERIFPNPFTETAEDFCLRTVYELLKNKCNFKPKKQNTRKCPISNRREEHIFSARVKVKKMKKMKTDDSHKVNLFFTKMTQNARGRESMHFTERG